MLTRRTILQGVTAAAIAPSMSIVPSVGAPVAAEPLLAFVVGTPGDFDGACVFARTAREAFEQWSLDQGTLEDDGSCERCDSDKCTCDHTYYATRMERWDNLGHDPTPADWMKAGMGYMCERCDNEQGFGDGYEIDGKAICVDCMELADWKLADPERYEEQVDELLTEEYGPDLRHPEWW